MINRRSNIIKLSLIPTHCMNYAFKNLHMFNRFTCAHWWGIRPRGICLTNARDVTGSELISGIACVRYARHVVVCCLVWGFGRVRHLIRNTSNHWKHIKDLNKERELKILSIYLFFIFVFELHPNNIYILEYDFVS